MGRLKTEIRLFNKEELLQIHKASLELLSEPGMQFDEVEFLKVLEKKGCNVDYKDIYEKIQKEGGKVDNAMRRGVKRLNAVIEEHAKEF